MRALVLDRDPVARAVLEEALGRGGHEVLSLRDGDQAWRALSAEHGPSLALLDWRGPDLDGVELCRRLRGLGTSAPYTVLLAAPGERDVAGAALAAGADDVLHKPLSLPEVELRLRLAARAQAAREELVRLRADLARRGRVDQLTGVEDRQAISARLDGELARAARTAAALSVMLVDVDHFRNINDVFGHDAGDAVLAALAARIRRVLRRYDAIGRWGAEEFLLLLPGCGADHARQLAERLLAAVRAEAVPTAQGRVCVTCSVGALCLPPVSEAPPLIEEVAEAVARGAGEAKEAGGDQAVVYALPERGGAVAAVTG